MIIAEMKDEINKLKRKKGKHIEKEMFESAMQKEIGKELVYLEIRRHKEVQPKHIVQVHSISSKHITGNEYQHIDNEQVLGNRRHVVHNVYPLFVLN